MLLNESPFLYIAFVSLSETGVLKKVRAQFSEFSVYFKTAYLLIINSDSNTEEISVENIKVVSVKDRSILKRRIIKFDIIKKEIDLIVNISNKKPIVYFRYPGADYEFYKLLKFYRNIFWITEHQSIELKELLTTRKYIKYLSGRIWQKKIFSLLNMQVFVHHKIIEYHLGKGTNLRNPIVMINGIDVNSVNIVKDKGKYIRNTINMLFVGSIQKWHGLDRVIKGLDKYEKRDLININIVGNGEENIRLQKLTKMLKLENQIKFHTWKTSSELDYFFNSADIAIGSLAIHHAGIGSPLKIKEYCARGVPFIDSSDDADFKEDFPFLLKIKSEDTPLDFDEIIKFYKYVNENEHFRQEMRAFAKRNLDWEVKIKNLLQEIGKLYN